ncbi:helix-turn-helix domain-containing protein [Streptomyces virginiae]|uniref:helix-turn-helix domain-containing protein n=1 Tax=Streptomyces virginiae TaxID=1961 RepID=UPI00364FCB1B
MRKDVQVIRQLTQHGHRLLVKVRPHPNFPDAARRLGGRHLKRTVHWEHWQFDARSETYIRALCLDTWGTDGSLETDRDLVVVRWTNPDDAGRQELWLAGRFVAARSSRDTKVYLGHGVTVLQGGFPSRGGTTRQPRIEVDYGTVLEIRDVPRVAAEKAAGEERGVEIVETAPVLDLDDLRERRTVLLQELAALNELLQEPVVEPTAPQRCRCGSHECPPVGLSTTEVAERAGVTVTTVGTWCRTGALPAIRHGWIWIVTEPLPARVGRTRIPPAAG